MEEKKYYRCYRMRLMSYLTSKGFKFLWTEPDLKNSKYILWIYEDTPELRQVLDVYFDELRERNIHSAKNR